MARVCCLILAAVLASGCRPTTESQAQHAAHDGDAAMVVHGDMASVPVAMEKEDCQRMEEALETQDKASLDKMMTGGKAMELPKGTRVRVVGESFNERKIRVEEGAHSGKVGWVPFEWLKLLEGDGRG